MLSLLDAMWTPLCWNNLNIIGNRILDNALIVGVVVGFLVMLVTFAKESPRARVSFWIAAAIALLPGAEIVISLLFFPRLHF